MVWSELEILINVDLFFFFFFLFCKCIVYTIISCANDHRFQEGDGAIFFFFVGKFDAVWRINLTKMIRTVSLFTSPLCIISNTSSTTLRHRRGGQVMGEVEIALCSRHSMKRLQPIGLWGLSMAMPKRWRYISPG